MPKLLTASLFALLGGSHVATALTLDLGSQGVFNRSIRRGVAGAQLVETYCSVDHVRRKYHSI